MNITENFSLWHLINPAVTFIVGLVAFGVYWWQKKDKKEYATAIILMEIRLAEKGIEFIKRSGTINPNIYNPLVISNHWIEYSHLFVKNLDQNEMDSINNFYNDCITIDKAIEQLSISKQLEQKSKAIHDNLSKIALEAGTPEKFKEKKDKFINLIFPDPTVFPAASLLTTIENKIKNINSIMNSNTGAKLKKIAGYK